MKHFFCLICLMLVLPGCAISEPPRPEPPMQEAMGGAVIAPRARPPVPTLVPSEQILESGLRWRECALPDLDGRQAEACLGPLPALGGDEDAARMGARTEHGLILQDGENVYEARTGEFGPLVRSALYANGRRLQSLWDGNAFHSPNISLQIIDGQVAWEFYGQRVQTVFYGRQDLSADYGLDAAYRPYELAGKLLLVGKRDDRSFIIYDGEQVGAAFDEIVIGHCCEIMLYAPRFGQGQYVFWGKRGSGYRIVEITSAAVPLPTMDPAGGSP
jgi:hypothetical protein